jgi:hypothetical protein
VPQSDSDASKMSRTWPTKGCWAMDTQPVRSDLDMGPVVYDTNFELKKSQLLITFPFVCLNNLKFIDH